jgi:hypothetical protein
VETRREGLGVGLSLLLPNVPQSFDGALELGKKEKQFENATLPLTYPCLPSGKPQLPAV